MLPCGVSGDALSAMRALYGRFALDHRVTLSHIDDGNGDLNHFAQYFGPQIDGTGPQDLSGARLTTVEMMGNAGTWSSFFSGRHCSYVSPLSAKGNGVTGPPSSSSSAQMGETGIAESSNTPSAMERRARRHF